MGTWHSSFPWYVGKEVLSNYSQYHSNHTKAEQEQNRDLLVSQWFRLWRLHHSGWAGLNCPYRLWWEGSERHSRAECSCHIWQAIRANADCTYSHLIITSGGQVLYTEACLWTPVNLKEKHKKGKERRKKQRHGPNKQKTLGQKNVQK